MSDQATRELERRFRASGSVADEAAWLTARSRAGELAPERLVLLAHVGSAGARRLLGPDAPKPVREVEAWLEAILDQAPELGLRAALAAVRQLLPGWEHRPERCGPHGALRCAQGPCRPDPRLRSLLLPLTASILEARLDPELLQATRASLAAEEQLQRDPVSRSVRTVGQRWSDEENITYDEGAWRRHAARAGFLAGCAALALHGSVEQRLEVRSMVEGHRLPEVWVQVPGGSRAIGPDEPEWEPGWARAALALARRAAIEGLPTLRGFARETAAARRIDAAWATQEALEELRAAVKKELLPVLLGLDDPLRKRAAPGVRGGG